MTGDVPHPVGGAGGPVCPPELLARIADLELVARIIVEGLVSGLHRSPFHGYSAEFSQYRHYRPGDDLKYVDWKLLARTDRLYTKQFRETTNMAAAIVIDTSASMAFPAGDRQGDRAGVEISLRDSGGGGAGARDFAPGRRDRAARAGALPRAARGTPAPARRAGRAVEAQAVGHVEVAARSCAAPPSG